MKHLFFAVITCVTLSLLMGVTTAAQPKDRLKNAFKQSHTAMSEPYSSDIEADQLFQESNQITIGQGKPSVGLDDNVVVRITRFLMRFALIAAVSMLIYSGIRIGLALGDSGKMQTAVKEATKVLLGVFIVLASVAIVFLISSLTRGTLDYALFNQ